jgi:hypothetical protein
MFIDNSIQLPPMTNIPLHQPMKEAEELCCG